MGKIVISTNVSLDGVVQDPDGEEGFRLGGWFGQFGGKDLEAWAKVSLEEALDTEALLLGRRSDEWFAERWLSRSGERAAGVHDDLPLCLLLQPRHLADYLAPQDGRIGPFGLFEGRGHDVLRQAVQPVHPLAALG